MRPSDALPKYGSDKTTPHSYGPLYDTILGGGPVRAILEVGVSHGGSLRAWHACLPEATVYGLDVGDPPDLPADRCRFARVDAADPGQVQRALAGWGVAPGSLDVVVDDASHAFRDQIATFHLLWDYVAAGGWYVIEDIDPGTPVAPFVRLGGVVHDLRGVKGRYDDVVVFRKPSDVTRSRGTAAPPTRSAPAAGPQPPSDGPRAATDTLVAVTYCAEHVKSSGPIDGLAHTRMLKAVVDQFAPAYPVLVAATGFTVVDLPDDEARALTWEVFRTARVSSLRHNPAHQYGACWCLQQALEYAAVAGHPFLVVLSDDIVIEPAEVARVVGRLRAGADYVRSHWGDDPASLNTQVFGCRVAALRGRYVPQEFQDSGVILEHYVGAVARRHGLRADVQAIDYRHTHDPSLFFDWMAAPGPPAAG